MRYSDYKTMVERLTKDPMDLFNEATPYKLHLAHMAMGITTESGELVGAIKKVFAYNQEPDIENVIEELGDLEFYMESLRKTLGITREEVLEANYDKLSERYPENKYTDKDAKARADK